jgi:hypothetical protein
MGDINLTNPLVIVPNATKVTNYSWQITPDGITVNLNYYSSAGQVVQHETFYITGADWVPLRDAVVQSGQVGQKFIDIIEKAIRNKVLALKGWTGTVP